MGPHFPRQIFVYKREKIFIFNSRGDYNPEGVIMEFCSCIKKLNLTHKEIVVTTQHPYRKLLVNKA